MARYLIKNGPMPTTAAPVPVATGTSIKTMMQVKPGATVIAKVKAWGYSFSGFAAAAPGIVELVETDVAATVTAYVAADLTKLDAEALAGADPTTAKISVGTASSGYTASGEGSITAIRELAPPQQGAPTSQYVEKFALGEEPVIQAAKFARIRMTFAVTINALCWMIIEVG